MKKIQIRHTAIITKRNEGWRRNSIFADVRFDCWRSVSSKPARQHRKKFAMKMYLTLVEKELTKGEYVER